jgi:hypothetical protein
VPVSCICFGVCFRVAGGYSYSPRVAAGAARGSTVRGPGRGGSSSLAVVVPGRGLPGAEREYGDLGFPGDGLLGRGGVPEFSGGLSGLARSGARFRVCSAARAAPSAAAASVASDENAETWEEAMERTAW